MKIRGNNIEESLKEIDEHGDGKHHHGKRKMNMDDGKNDELTSEG